jgi:hypothetical protein
MSTYLVWRREPTADNIQMALSQFQARLNSRPESITTNPKDASTVATLALGLVVQATGGCLKNEFWLKINENEVR